MAENNKKLKFEDDVMRISVEFQTSMFALITDYLDISPEKSKAIYSLVDRARTNKKERTRASFLNYIDKSKKFSQFQYAMFNYMNSIFERSMNDILKLAVRSQKDIRNIYIKKFIDFEDKQDKKIRDAKYENLSDKQRTEFQLSYFEQIITLKPDNWQFLLNIPNEVMWSDKDLKFEYTELRARRHLLTHRGYFFDKKYVEDIKNSVIKSKNSDDPKKLFQDFHRSMFFTITKDKLNNIDDLVKTKQYSVDMTKLYVISSFTVLVRLFHMVQCYLLSKDYGYTTNIQIEAIKAGVNYRSPGLLLLTREICMDLLKIKNKEIHDYEKCNYLISCIEMRNIVGEDYKKRRYEEDFLNYLSDKKDPLIKFLIAYYHNDKKRYKSLLEEIDNDRLSTDAESWPLFNGIKHNRTWMKIIKTKIDARA